MGRPEATCFGGHLVEGCTIFSTCEMVIAELSDISFMRLMDKHTRVGEVFGIETNGKSEAAIKKEITRRKARPKPQGCALVSESFFQFTHQGAAPHGGGLFLFE